MLNDPFFIHSCNRTSFALARIFGMKHWRLTWGRPQNDNAIR